MYIVGITGHQNLPEHAIDFIRQGINSVLRPLNGDFVGVSSLAAGADQLFAESVVKANGRLHAVIPCHEYQSIFTNAGARRRFNYFLERAYFIETLAYDQPSEDAFLAAGQRVVKHSNLLIAVWDGLEAKGKGGTADVVHYAHEHGKDVSIVWPPGVVR